MTEQINELYIRESYDVLPLLNELSKEERQFVYYIFRAGLPFDHIVNDQYHRASNELIKLFSFLYKLDLEQNLKNDIRSYLVYLYANHGNYFLREEDNNKRTPEKIALVHLTPNTLTNVLTEHDLYDQNKHLYQVIFDSNYEPTRTTQSIETSGGNMYSRNFTDADYEKVPDDLKARVNLYFYKDDDGNVQWQTYSEKYKKELDVSVYWLSKALEIAKQNPQHFDQHTSKSLNLLIQFLETGDEEKFKEHTKEWIKMSNRVDYTTGFIETYLEPKEIRGGAASEVTVKAVDMKSFIPLVMAMEARFPVPVEYKKMDSSQATVNTSINVAACGSGEYGPAKVTAAYCLPNYDDIRSTYGSKQVLYQTGKPLSDRLNAELTKKLKTTKQLEFLNKYDENNDLSSLLWDVQVLLHESLGHASGKYATHKTGVEVNDKNIGQLIYKDYSSLEELRAEIIALYTGIAEMDTLIEGNIYKGWEKIGKDVLKEKNIENMCALGLSRLMQQSNNFDKITGAHARANVTILNFLMESGSVIVSTENKVVDKEEYTLLDIKILDIDIAWNTIIKLMQEVQRIKSTGDGEACCQLFDTYTCYPMTIEKANEYKSHMDKKRKKLIGDIKMEVNLFPKYTLENNELIVGKYNNFLDQMNHYDQIRYEKLL
jgi:Peptidase family M49